MKTLYLVILSIVIFTVSCADPAANKPKAVTSEPATNTAANTAAKPADAGGTELAITPENSKIEFTGSKVTGKHEGGFKQFKGAITLVGDKAETSRVKVDIETASVFTDADGLTKHLQTGDFFEVSKFPTATFTSTKIEPDTAKGGNNFTVTGDLELHGVKKAVTFPAEIDITADEVTVKAEFSINRKDFGILYAGKADDLIRDNVVIRLDLKSAAKKMKAWEIREFGIDNLTLTERERPVLAANEVLVKLHAASLNYRDVMVVEGTYNPRMRVPAIPFSDAAGEVVKIGDAVSKWKPGDRVCSLVIAGWLDGGPTVESSKTAIGAGRADGVLREFATFDEGSMLRIPDHLGFEEASTLPCAALTAWHAMVESGKLKAGDAVLTLGTGGVSVFALQFAKLFGARVIATSSSDEKIAKLKALGADDTINYRYTPDWDKAVLEMTGGRGVDHVIEVGGMGTLARSINSVRVGGHVALIGALDTSGEFNPIPIFMKGIRVQGIFIGSRKMFEDMNAKIEAGSIRPVIDREFGFDEVRDALRYMKTGAHFGKIVVRYQ